MLRVNPLLTSPRSLFEAESIGTIAFDSIATNQDAILLGRTSRGIFIKPANKWLLFISSEPFHGPLTINIGKIAGLLRTVTSGMPVYISSKQLVFPVSDLKITFEKANLWNSTPPQFPPSPEAERTKRLRSACERVLKMNSGVGLAPLLPVLLKSQDQTPQDLSPFQAKIISLYEKLRSSVNPNLLEFMIKLLGNGSGLTPSGDDFVLGFLLALNRWGFILFPESNPRSFNTPIVETAYQKTTTLSANLIECAALGQADERLIAALDWLMSGISPDLACFDEMLKWGHSSGIDVLVGFIFALSARDICAIAE